MHLYRAIPSRVMASFSLGLLGAVTLAACGGGSGSGGGTGSSSGNQTTGQTTSGFADSALVANKVGVVATATTIDANLSNPWGLVTAPGLPFWIADNNSNLATLYSGTGAIQTDAVTGSTDVGVAIPASTAGIPANPTGQVTMAAAASSFLRVRVRSQRYSSSTEREEPSRLGPKTAARRPSPCTTTG